MYVANWNQLVILAAIRYKRDSRSSYYKRSLQDALRKDITTKPEAIVGLVLRAEG
ncbi:MAG: hypothetical protein ACFFDI_09690 [Promethearchaeota archaeon]